MCHHPYLRGNPRVVTPRSSSPGRHPQVVIPRSSSPHRHSHIVHPTSTAPIRRSQIVPREILPSRFQKWAGARRLAVRSEWIGQSSSICKIHADHRHEHPPHGSLVPFSHMPRNGPQERTWVRSAVLPMRRTIHQRDRMGSALSRPHVSAGNDLSAVRPFDLSLPRVIRGSTTGRLMALYRHDSHCRESRR